MSALGIAQYAALLQGENGAWDLPVDHLSPSSFAMAQRCPYQWQQRYIHGRKERPGEAPVMGTAVHAALERNFAQKILTRTDLNLTDLLTWYMDAGWPETVHAEQEKAGEEIAWDTGPEETRKRGYSIVGVYHDIVAPRIQPLRVETRIEVDFGLPVPIVGRFDLERESSTVDFKTGKQKQSKPKEDWRIQAAVYGEATSKPVEFHSLSASPKTNAVQIVTPLESEALLVNPTSVEREEMKRTLRAIAAELNLYWQMFGPDEPWPTKGRFHQWACDYCGYRAGCPAWRES